MNNSALYGLLWAAAFIALCLHPTYGLAMLALWLLVAAARGVARSIVRPLVADGRAFLRSPHQHLLDFAAGFGVVAAVAGATYLFL